MVRYTTIKVHGVIIAIGKPTKINGYTETVLEALLPSDEELDNMSHEECVKLTDANNEFMQHVCDAMNKCGV